MAVKRWQSDRAQFFDSNGDPLNGGKLFFYVAGSSTKQNTFNSSAGSVANANPLVLDSAGRPSSEIWMTTGVSYKIILTNSTDSDPPASPIWTEDNVQGINDSTLVLDEWISGPTPTYVSSTSFTVVGDQTSTLLVGRRVKVVDSGGTKYGTIKTSAYTSLTTITLDSQDSDALATPLSTLAYGIFSPTNTSHPVYPDSLTVIGGSADRSKRLRFEVDGFTTGTTRVITPPDANLTLPNASTQGQIPIATSTGVLGMAAALNKAIYGLTYSNNGIDATNDLDIAAGGCMDATGAYWITVSALTKQSDAAWAVGTNAGGLDTGAVGNSDYYIWAITRSDTGVTDILYSLSATAPTMPANYDFKRRIGWFRRSGGSIVAFSTHEIAGGAIHWLWSVVRNDYSVTNPGTSASLRTLSAPVGIKTGVIHSIDYSESTADAVGFFLATSPEQADTAPSSTLYDLRTDSGGRINSARFLILTNTSAQIRTRASRSDIDTSLVGTTHGFIDWRID